MLRVHEDGSLTAIMERASRQSSGDDGEDGESANEDAESEDDDNMFGDDEPSYGYAWDDEGTGEHDVAFVISVWRPQDGEGTDMTCKGRLSARGLTGTYRNLKEHGGVTNLYEDEDDAVDGGTDFPFELVARPEAFSVERLEASCLPLTPGRFSFYGHALTNMLDLLNSDVAMVLRADGTVTGEIEERLGQNQLETGRLTGTWEPEQIGFTMTRKRKMYPKCSFVAQPSVVGRRGLWLTSAFLPDDFRFESGLFDFKFYGCRGRAWSEAMYPYFQPHFRKKEAGGCCYHQFEHHWTPPRLRCRALFGPMCFHLRPKDGLA